MNTHLKYLIVIVLMVGFAGTINAQQYPSTVITVMGTRYGDTMWLFTVAGTTNGFDNGWDGFKMFGGSLVPQIFAVGSDLRYYQVYTSSNIHGANIWFRKGEDSVYTLHFRHFYLNLGYQQLYLLDKKTSVITDIYSEGSTYSFISEAGDALDRFVVLTYLENTVNPGGSTGDGTGTGTGDGTGTGTGDGTGTGTGDGTGTGTGDGTGTGTGDGTGTGTGDGTGGGIVPNPEPQHPGSKGLHRRPEHPRGKQFKVFVVNGDIVVDNREKNKAEVIITDASSGRKIKSDVIPAERITTIRTNLKKGAYVVNVKSGRTQTSTTIIY